MTSTAPSYEFILRHFQARQGLYILGAGASAGEAPFGESFMVGPALDYVRNSGAFPVTIPTQSELNQRIIRATSGILPGSMDFHLLQRLPNFHARLFLKHVLSTARFSKRCSHSYQIFQLFHPSLLLNYNLDGLATDLCSKFHRVIDVHGTIQHEYGSPRVAEVMAALREFDLPVSPDGLLLCVPESPFDIQLARRLLPIATFSPHFIAIIGYSFGRNGETYDDRVSLDCFQHAFRGFQGNIYVVNPNPGDLRDMVAESLRSKSVFGIRVYWNLLAHAFMETLSDRNGPRSLYHVHEQMLDMFGSGVAFPLAK